MNIFAHEFRARLKSVLIWSAAIAALILVFMAVSTAFTADQALVSQLMASLPRELLIAFGMADLDWSTILGYYGLIAVFVQICLAIQAANYGFGLVSIEESEWTADFLLAKPVSRGRILSAKLLAALVGLAITQAVVWTLSWLAVRAYSAGEAFEGRTLALLLASLVPFQLFFLTVGVAISLLVRRVRSVTPYAMGLVFGLYILNAFSGLTGKQSLEVLSPFKHFAPDHIIRHAAWDLPLALISVVIGLLAVAAAYLLYAKRDIPSAV